MENKRLDNQTKEKLKQVGLAFGLFLVVFIAGKFVTGSVQHKVDSVSQARYALENKIKAEEAKQTLAVKQASYGELEGLSGSIMDVDQKTAETFFHDAFSWKDGATYNKIRNDYISKLGADSSFVRTYLPENPVAEGANQIDLTNKKFFFDHLNLYPVDKVPTGYSYYVFITYYQYKEATDLQHLSSLVPSYALVKCQITGNGDKKVVSDIYAYPFSD